MLTQFRKRYPHGSLISELVQIDRNQYIVKALVQVNGITLATGLSAADTVEQAEEQAINRALARIDLSETNTNHKEIEEAKLRSPAQLSEPIIEDREKREPEKVVAPKDSHVKSDYRSEFPLSQDKVESTESLPLLSNGVTSAQTIDDGLAKTQLDFLEATSEPDDRSASLTTSQLPLVETTTPSPAIETRSTFSNESIDATDLIEPTDPEPIDASDLIEPTDPEPIDASDLIEQTNIELKRLGWTQKQGRDYLVEAYGKRSRLMLLDEELQDFLRYLKSQPSP
jgi:hypothetical protein